MIKTIVKRRKKHDTDGVDKEVVDGNAGSECVTAAANSSGDMDQELPAEPTTATGQPSVPTPPAVSLKGSGSLAQVPRCDSVETIADDDDDDDVSSHREYYTGGVSQWREYEESSWDQWDWPPHGWRPSTYHDCYWNTNSQWYQYNHKKWDWGVENADAHTPPPNSSRPSLGSTGSTCSLELDGVVDMLARSQTGDITPMVLQEPAVEPPVEPPVTPQPKGESNQKLNSNVAEESKTAQNPETKAEDGKGEIAAEGNDPAEVLNAELEKKRKLAHARYMRYYRSIRSHGLSMANSYIFVE